MKSLFRFFAASILFSTLALAAGPTQLVVEGMTCGGCEKSVKAAFAKHPEVKSVEVDVKKGLVTLTFQAEKSLTEQQIREAVKGAGYKVTKVSTSS